MNIALITAGGTGSRIPSVDRPKQFSYILGKPVIVYTMEQFEQHSDIDIIAIVCLEGWEDELWGYAEHFGIRKLKHIIPGGASNQESIRNGIMLLSEQYGEDAMILVHDAVRPMVTQEIITDCLRVARKHGNAVASLSSIEPLLKIEEDGISSLSYHSRSGLARAQAPQCFRLGDLTRAHSLAKEKGIKDATCCATLMHRLGERIHLSKSATSNIKITLHDDLLIFEALQKNIQNNTKKRA